MTDLDLETELAKPHWIQRVVVDPDIPLYGEQYCAGATNPHPDCTEHQR